MHFKSILACRTATELEDQKNITQRKWKFSFLLVTQERPFTLYCCSQKERQMWLAAFDYVIAST